MPKKTDLSFDHDHVAEPEQAREERAAWDYYASAATGGGAFNGITPALAARWADQLLEERRKRFGGASK